MQNNYETFLCLWDSYSLVMVSKESIFALLIANFCKRFGEYIPLFK